MSALAQPKFKKGTTEKTDEQTIKIPWKNVVHYTNFETFQNLYTITLPGTLGSFDWEDNKNIFSKTKDLVLRNPDYINFVWVTLKKTSWGPKIPYVWEVINVIVYK